MRLCPSGGLAHQGQITPSLVLFPSIGLKPSIEALLKPLGPLCVCVCVCVCCQLEKERKRGIWKGVVQLKERKGDMVIPENGVALCA